MPAAHVNDSRERSQNPLGPPKPFHRPMGTSASRPARSAAIAVDRTSSQFATCGGPSANVTPAVPPDRLMPNTPSFKVFGLVMISAVERSTVWSAVWVAPRLLASSVMRVLSLLLRGRRHPPLHSLQQAAYRAIE